MAAPPITRAAVTLQWVCAACEEDAALQRTPEVSSDQVGDVPDSVQQTLRAPGRPLDDRTRSFFETRFSADFSAVRIHDDAQAARSAGDVGARAYAVGRHIALAANRFAPDTTSGRHLLAHELTHTVQQRADPPVLRRAPPEPAGEGTTSTATCLIHFVKARTEFTDAKEFAACMASIKAWLAADSTRTVELSGFASEEGDEAFNTTLAQQRADTVKNLLKQGGVPDAKLAATGRGTDKTYPKLEDNRRVEILHPKPKPEPPPTEVPADPVTATPCPPKSAVQASDLGSYVTMMQCAEKQMGLGTREMLTVFRQIYYGKPWSVETNPHWDEVIPCPASVGDPTARLGQPLMDSLKKSQSIGSVDVGHVFAGLEAMMCPTSEVVIEKTGITWTGATTVDASNENFSTWVGDLGQSVAALAGCMSEGDDAPKQKYCSGQKARPLRFYLERDASEPDLQGDIAPFVMRAQLAGIPCAGSAQTKATLPAKKMSEIFDDYYNDPNSAPGKAHGTAASCFLAMVGAKIAGKKVTNREEIVGAMAAQVSSFAHGYYYKLRDTTPNTQESLNIKYVYSPKAVNWFLDWLERQL